MKRLIRKLARAAHHRLAGNYLGNALALSLVLVETYQRPRLVDVPEGKRILVLAPHMDDETLGCGGTLRKHVLGGASVTVAFMTDGRHGDPELNAARLPEAERHEREQRLVETRKEESRRAADIIGIEDLVFLDQPDGELSVNPGVVASLAHVLRTTRPDLVYLPFLTERHRDHYETGSVFLEAIRTCAGRFDHLQCCGYEVWSPLLANTLVDIGAVLPNKRLAIQQFESQLRHVDYLNCILGLGAYRSIEHLGGRGHAEAFFLTSLARYEQLYRYLASWPNTAQTNLGKKDHAHRLAGGGAGHTHAE